MNSFETEEKRKNDFSEVSGENVEEKKSLDNVFSKFKINQHEFPLAEKAFLEEVKTNPANAEAWFLIL